MKPGLFRLVLALIVVLFHVNRYVYLGHFAVYCFFILSGYWITYMYSEKYSKAKTVLIYYVSRYWRLMPIYLFFAFLVFLYQYITKANFPYSVTEHLSKSGKFLFWLGNIILLGVNQLEIDKILLTPAWSLDIELQFYLVFPLLYMSLKRKSSYFILFFLLFLNAILFIFFQNTIFQKTVLGYLIYFYLGGFLFFNMKKISSIILRISYLLIIISLLIPFFAMLLNFSFEKNSFVNEIYNAILPLFLVPFIQKNVSQKSSEKDKILGNLSYIVYFCHWFWYIPYSTLVLNVHGNEKLIYGIVYLIIVFSSSILVYYLIDCPMETFRRSWLQKQIT